MAEANTTGQAGRRIRDVWHSFQQQLSLFRRPENRRLTIGLLFGAACLAMVAVTWLWWQDRDYRPLYGRQEQYDAGAVIDQLDTAGIAYRVHPDTGQVMVRSAELPQARMALATGGITPSLPEGRALLTESSPLGISHFMERQRYIAAIEGELVRTIMTLQPVRSARVHLAIPEQTVFLRQSPEPRASVVLELNAGARLTPLQIEGVVNLVAGSIANLDRNNISVVDQLGAPISDELDETTLLSEARRQLQYQSEIERRLESRVLSLLAPLVGSGNVRVQVSAELDMTSGEQTREVYSPDNEAVRSESMQQVVSGNELPTGTPGALENVENTTGKASVQEKQYVRNYEVDRTVSREQRLPGELRRLTVAVLLNTRQAVQQTQATQKAQPWSDEELGRMTVLVKQAVGYTASRGDQISVESLPFVTESLNNQESSSWWQQPAMIAWAGRVLLALIIVLLLFVGIRPLVLRWLKSKHPAAQPEPGRESSVEGLSGMDKPSATTETSYDDDTVGFQHRVDALKQLARQEPGKVAHVLRQWLSEKQVS